MPGVKTNKFDLSHDLKLSFKMGQLIPTTVMDVLPGDIVNISTENLLRFAPLVSPVMHKVKVNTHYFFVPTVFFGMNSQNGLPVNLMFWLLILRLNPM